MSIKLNLKKDTIDLSHGAGGKAMAMLIDQLFRKCFDNDILAQQSDAAVLSLSAKRIAVSTDTYVISPLFFPGGDIGSLAIHGTVNDVALSGATVRYITVGLVIEEGFPLSDLKRIVESMALAAKLAGVCIVTGDTKVVERGKGDGVFINTTGIGVFDVDVNWQQRPQIGDKIILSGQIGNHGVAVMSKRQNLSFDSKIVSDSAALNGLIAQMRDSGCLIRTMRDPTRGGIAATLNEWAHQFGVGVHIDESNIPVHPTVQSACELLGLDPLNIANEGKLLAIVAAQDAEKLLAVMRQHPLAEQAAMVGEITEDRNHFVSLTTSFGGRRMVQWISGEQLPRIC